MKRRSFSRTRPWRSGWGHDAVGRATPAPRVDSHCAGSVTVIVLLLMVVFAGLGLAMLHASGVHVKINGFRRSSTLLDCASENGLKRGLRDLAAWLETEGLLAPVTDAAVEAVRTDPRRGFPLLVEGAFGAAFPRLVEESFDGLSWESRTECVFGGVADMGGYLRIEAPVRIEATGSILGTRAGHLSTLEGSLGFLAGRLPLAAIPFYIKGELGDGEKTAFAAANGIRLAAKPGQPLGAGVAAAPDGVLPDDAGRLAAKALAVGVFEPGRLSPAQLRRALGLEASMEPVPDGVYLIENDLGLGGVFVQGPLDELVLAVRGDSQIVVFRAGGDEWRLEWSPARSRTEFITPAGSRIYDLVPLPLLFVNGLIASLGGGTVRPDGRVEMSFDDRTPAVLSGVDLTIVSADQVTISSHLVLEGVRWRDGIPYSKDSEAQLVIYAAGRDVVTGETTSGGVRVAGDAPADLRLQASVTAAAGGFRIEGATKSVELLGGLQADAYEGNGSRLTLYRDDRSSAGAFPENSPLTARPQLAAYALKVLSWREY
jgi:hypothetical protein